MNKDQIVRKVFAMLDKEQYPQDAPHPVNQLNLIPNKNKKDITPAQFKGLLPRYHSFFMALIRRDASDLVRPTLQWLDNNFFLEPVNVHLLVPFFESVREKLFSKETNIYRDQFVKLIEFLSQKFKKMSETAQLKYIQLPDLSKKYNLVMLPIPATAFSGFLTGYP